MQLALRGKQLLIKRVAVLLMVLVVFCAPLIKPPVKVEAAVIPVVAGAAIVAAAMSALGIGVAAGFDTESLATAAQKVWDDLSDSVRQTIVLTQVAGHTVAHFTEQALRDIFSGLQTAFPQAASGGTPLSEDFPNGYYFTNVALTSDFIYKLYSDYYASVADAPSFSDANRKANYLFLGRFRYTTGLFYVPLTELSSGITLKDFKVRDATQSTYRDVSGYIQNGPFNSSEYVSFKSVINLPAAPFDFILGIETIDGYSHWVLFEPSGAHYTIYEESPIDASPYLPSVPDVFNPANEKFYADGVSTMNNSVDDVINRLKEGVGETGQISDQPDVITVPGQIVGDSVTDQTKGTDQAGTIGKDIATPDDIAANDVTNADRDTTKPSTPGEDTDIPDLSIPQIITNKFPFSIPWDLYNSVRILVAPAAAPKWVLPLRFDKLGVNTSITIDMAQFDGLAALSRWGLSLLFIISLIILSSKLVKR